MNNRYADYNRDIMVLHINMNHTRFRKFDLELARNVIYGRLSRYKKNRQNRWNKEEFYMFYFAYKFRFLHSTFFSFGSLYVALTMFCVYYRIVVSCA